MVSPGRTALPSWLGRAIGIGPLIGAVAGGALTWLPTHQLSTALVTSILVFLVIGGLRAADPFLEPVWRAIARVPRIVRIIGALAFSLWFSISQFGLDAGGEEVERARIALVGTILIAYVLIRPRAEES